MTDLEEVRVECKGCGGLLAAVGTFYACNDATCDRFALPVNEYGHTPEEHEDALDKQRDRMDEASDFHGSYYSSERMDAAREIL